jgi:hypothetical protein
MRRAGILGLALISSGCFDYQEVNTAARPASGTMVRVELSDAGTSNAAKAIGPYVMFVEGPLQSADERAITLSVTNLRRRGEGDTRWTGEALTLPREDIRQLAERHTARGRTAVAIAAFATAGVALLIAIANATGLVNGSTGRPPIPGT